MGTSQTQHTSHPHTPHLLQLMSSQPILLPICPTAVGQSYTPDGHHAIHVVTHPGVLILNLQSLEVMSSQKCRKEASYRILRARERRISAPNVNIGVDRQRVYLVSKDGLREKAIEVFKANTRAATIPLPRHADIIYNAPCWGCVNDTPTQ